LGSNGTGSAVKPLRACFVLASSLRSAAQAGHGRKTYCGTSDFCSFCKRQRRGETQTPALFAKSSQVFQRSEQATELNCLFCSVAPQTPSSSSSSELSWPALRRQRDVGRSPLPHITPLGWNHVNLTSDYVWHGDTYVQGHFRPLRPPVSPSAAALPYKNFRFLRAPQAHRPLHPRRRRPFRGSLAVG
jgi:hypothetical protein